MKTLISGSYNFSIGFNRQVETNGHRCALPFTRINLPRATQNLHAFGHTNQTETGPLGFSFKRRKTPAIILNCQCHGISCAFDQDNRTACLRVLDDVVEAFLDDAVERDRGLFARNRSSSGTKFRNKAHLSRGRHFFNHHFERLGQP